MKRNKSSISKASSYREIGEYWDTHDLSKIWGKTKRVKCLLLQADENQEKAFDKVATLD